MGYFFLYLFMFIFIAVISYGWTEGIDYMQKNHPDYKGEDFLNWDRKNDDWDKNNYEGDF